MNTAIVGGGSNCLYLMNFITSHQFGTFSPKILAVADINNDAVGLVEAKKRGLLVTNDYNEFFDRDDIELIIELTGNIDIYNDILTKKKKNVRAIAHTTALLFWEIARIAQKEQEAQMKLHESKTIYEVMINNLIEEDTMVIKTDFKISIQCLWTEYSTFSPFSRCLLNISLSMIIFCFLFSWTLFQKMKYL